MRYVKAVTNDAGEERNELNEKKKNREKVIIVKKNGEEKKALTSQRNKLQ